MRIRKKFTTMVLLAVLTVSYALGVTLFQNVIPRRRTAQPTVANTKLPQDNNNARPKMPKLEIA